ncbi:ATP-dependent zinc metalloprotease FtsH [Clostridium saccharobutylicum]|uniref:ATP-dependent zinc metalloprotease FtsH n=1 Tax=Clostridium saccharobutylicum DSM 13864 TaxID=1345695 RepID=U5MND1_CLOSA|nr:ATP-dependent zinc metalloprotease FtsH [Clostridium saccharobutylicum]AGX41201.1 ATP-dependent zinc metalloprotease FtsH [Clostridium saccharobutylicum DSM 13864]AQR88487.1 ATP-dependent zinc metalloprotease FtsH [Clostridium saccharobutylicum]AQR98385.1 ATP-dependent zinc metalloprotease FtsH [Clostridium saccharobutylicum]AQS08096.1 ATP-dependent zinc metalloprotease FtsH [Clostridium saccharobutylicum]AQS12375.1 ATP-dependent zinc metalloprotease FtsH [Clostridium saccharobutylicum]
MKKYSSAAVWIVCSVMLVLAAVTMWQTGKGSNDMTYSAFVQKWNANEIESVVIKEDKMTIEGKTTDNKSFVTYIPSQIVNSLIENQPKTDVRIDFEPPSNNATWVATLLPCVLLAVVIFIFLFMFTQQSQGGGGGRGVMNFGKSKAKMVTPESQTVTFDDVAGADEEKAELEEIVDFLKLPSRYVQMGARIPKGVLLVGPPGTGKTLLAKAIAGEAGVPFFSISGSDFVEMFVGVGASRVRSLFEEAKKNAPCIVFIDEIDAVGRQRGAGLGGGHDEREQTLNQLLVEMDGFGINEGIIMIAATNRPDILDPALLRPGRFDRQIVVGAPDVKGREEILKVHTKKKPLGESVNLNVLAKRTPGFSGADLENLANEAALLAVRRDKKEISMEEMEEAITRVIAGPEKKSRVITEHDKKLTAYHEAGHAVVMKLLPNCDPVHEISIIPRGRAGGYTMHLPKEDTSYTSKSKLKDEMVGLLGGRVAEKLIMGDISTGAKNDIDRASHIAKSMVMDYGMSDEIGTISYNTTGHDEVFLGRDLGKSRDFSEEVGAKIDKEIKRFIDEAYDTANKLLKSNTNKLHAVAQALIEKEKLDANEFEDIFANS